MKCGLCEINVLYKDIYYVCGCRDEAGDYHECPYAADVDNNPDSECNCCPKCTQSCADDI